MSLLVALAFLTRIPVGPRGRGELGAAAWAFPLVGALVGLVVGLVGVGGSLVLPVLVAAVLAVLAEVLLTGALHLDGLADCADGCGGRDRQSRLRIMKDSTVGVYGVSAVVLDLLLKVALLHGLLLALPGWGMLLLLPLAYAVSRAAVLPVALALPSARPAGTGAHLLHGLTRGGVVGALAVTLALLAVVLVVVLVMTGLLAGGVPAGSTLVTAALLAVVGGGVGALLVARWARRTLGGATGDVLGAVVEASLAVALVAVSLTL